MAYFYIFVVSMPNTMAEIYYPLINFELNRASTIICIYICIFNLKLLCAYVLIL